ncbi:hypothetical protein AAG906_037827 [Vitis piasezkii]
MMGLKVLLWVMRIQSYFNLLLNRPWIHEVGAIPYSLHQKISHSDDDLHLTGFTFDEFQVVSLKDDSRDMMPMSFDQYNSTLVLSMMRGMSYLPGLGLGHRQVSARLSGIPFDYPLCPYTFRLADYFIRGSEHVPHMEGIDHILEIMHLSYVITKGSDVVIVEPSSPGRASMFSMCFPDKVLDYGLFVDFGGGTDGVTLDDEYTNEMDMIGIGRILNTAPHGPHSAFDLFGISMLELDGDDSITDVATLNFTSVKEASNLVDPHLSFDSLFNGFRDLYQPRKLKISSSISLDERRRLINLLRSYLDEEIKKQLSVGFLSMVKYPEWLANVVPVPKKDNKVRVCVDFRDLKKASPKDDFSFPHIDMLVDNTTGHSMLSFDMEKTSFIIEWGTYCYRVMPFGLKNAGATYQRVATTLFHDMMHKDVEVYVDDMIVKSRDRANHLATL